MSAPTLGGTKWRCAPWAQELLDLKPGWDSYGAHLISPLALATLGKFVVVPVPSGGVRLEIHQDGWEIEIAIGPDGTITGATIEGQK